MNAIMEKRIVIVVRWAGRILSVLLLGLVVVLAIGEAKPEHLREMVLGNALFTILLGLVIAWKWEGLGSLLILGGFTVFAIVNGSSRTFSPFNLLLPSLVAGLLFLFCWWRTRKT